MEVTTSQMSGGGVKWRLPLVRCRGEVSNGGYRCSNDDYCRRGYH